MLQSYSFFSTLRVSASAFKRFLSFLVIHRRAFVGGYGIPAVAIAANDHFCRRRACQNSQYK